jgi:hypothetical protein
MEKHSKTRDLFAVLSGVLGRSEVERVAGYVLKRDALKDYNAFEKESRGSAEKLGLSGDLKYDYELTPTLELRAPASLRLRRFPILYWRRAWLRVYDAL